MQITCRGAHRNHGKFTMVSHDITKRDPYFSSGKPNWDAVKGQVAVECRGHAPSGKGEYDYEVQLTASEIFYLLELALPSVTKDTASRAVGVGAISALRELLTK